MLTGWRYRTTSVVGVMALTALAVVVANQPPLQRLLTAYVPVVWRLDPMVLDGRTVYWAMLITAGVVTASFFPLYRPEPRRVLDTVFRVEKRVLFAVCALATLGYFNYSYRLPRQTLLLAGAFLAVALPVLFAAVTQSPTADADRALVVGNDPRAIDAIAETFDRPLVGYVAPPTPYWTDGTAEPASVTDGGNPGFERGYVGGLSRLDEAIRDCNVDAVLLAFDEADRAEFFGTLHTCYEHGVDVKAHVDHTDSLLVDAAGGDGEVVDVDIEPWDVQDRLLKRAFDLAFAGAALLVLFPIVALIALAIRIEGHGPVLFSQERTYRFGDTFTVYKFRTLKPEPDEEVATAFDEHRRTPLGDFLRTTHLDEIPQLWSILVGDMSVVGPRPAQTELETEFEAEAQTWKQRWFVKPGLTGLAQINDATSSEPSRKIDYDVAYIRKQSFVFDVKIVLRQVWSVVSDVVDLVTSR